MSAENTRTSLQSLYYCSHEKRRVQEQEVQEQMDESVSIVGLQTHNGQSHLQLLSWRKEQTKNTENIGKGLKITTNTEQKLLIYRDITDKRKLNGNYSVFAVEPELSSSGVGEGSLPAVDFTYRVRQLITLSSSCEDQHKWATLFHQVTPPLITRQESHDTIIRKGSHVWCGSNARLLLE